jgi:hypothetical protein
MKGEVMPDSHLTVLKAYVLDRVKDGLPVAEKFFDAIAAAEAARRK